MKHRCKLLIATIVSALCLAGPATAAKPAVVDQTGVSGFQDYLDENLPAPMKAALTAGRMAVWGNSTALRVQKNGYCVANVGITTPSTDQRMARRPAIVQNAIRRVSNVSEDWNGDDCRTEALRDAVAELAKSPLPTPDELRNTLSAGGTRPKEKVNNKTVRLESQNANESTQAAAFDTLHSYNLGATVDYRQVMANLYNIRFSLDGKNICFALFNLSPRPPADRQPRLSNFTAAGLYVGDNDASCERDASVAAINTNLDQPWNNKGVFVGFEQIREDGVPLPDLATVAKKRAALAATAAAKETQVRSTQRNVVRCSNVCTNGSCVRTFENGRKERWQAPRVYDPFKNDWTWDTSSCGQ